MINQADYGASFGNALRMAYMMQPQRNMLAPELPEATYSAMAQNGGPTVAAANALGDPRGMSPRELLARAIYSEAGAEPEQGKIAVGAVIANRLRNGAWGDDWNDVILAPGQFSAFNGVTGYAGGAGANDLWRKAPPEDIYRVADMVLSGQYADPTGGALNYYNPAAASPAWGDDNWQRIGNHVFGTAR